LTPITITDTIMRGLPAGGFSRLGSQESEPGENHGGCQEVLEFREIKHEDR
jgi:hypothetical protein